jgi:iron complex transport system substrate-binding protein
VYLLGRGGELVGVSHECDWPPEAPQLPALTRSRIPAEATSAAIDAAVAEAGGSLYELDADRLAALRPDVILTQAQCDVCAVNEAGVREVAATLPGPPHVESVNPLDLAGIFAMARRLGDLIGGRDLAEDWIGRFEALAAEVRRRRKGLPPARILHLEWLDPPFCSGHWNPELLALAGGAEAIGRAGEPSRRITWGDVATSEPEFVLLAPCGYTVGRGREDLEILGRLPEWRGLPAVAAGRVALADGSALFSRPGPRLLESLALTAGILDPGRCGDLHPPDPSLMQAAGEAAIAG